MGTRPDFANFQLFGERRSLNRPVYVTIGELYLWAESHYNDGTQYSDDYTTLKNAFKRIANMFDGSWGTFVSPFDGQTYSYPQILNPTDGHSTEEITDLYLDDYCDRLITFPLFNRARNYTNDNDVKWHAVLVSFVKRIERFCDFTTPQFKRIEEAMVIKYNPFADYFKNVHEQGGTSPYASIENDSNSNPKISNWTTSNGKANYKSETKSQGQQNINNYTTTYDDDSNTRLAGRQTVENPYNQNSSDTTNEIPNQGWFRKLYEDGNEAASPQEAIQKEWEIAKLFGNLVQDFCKELNKEIFLQIWVESNMDD